MLQIDSTQTSSSTHKTRQISWMFLQATKTDEQFWKIYGAMQQQLVISIVDLCFCHGQCSPPVAAAIVVVSTRPCSIEERDDRPRSTTYRMEVEVDYRRGMYRVREEALQHAAASG